MRTIKHTKHRRWASLLTILVAAFGLAGCDLDELLTVEDRDVVTPGSLEDEAGLPVVVAGAYGDFAAAYSGSTNGDSYVTVTALMADEFFSSGTFPTRTATDRRLQQSPSNGNTSDDLYIDLQFARRALKDAAARVAAEIGTSDADYRELKALEGYTLLMLGESFCSGVPLSNVVGGEFVYGPPLSSSELFDSAVAKFNVSQAAGASHLASIGEGRALLAKGDAAAAAAAVAGVPTDYVYFIFHSESGSSNDVFSKQNNGRFSQSDLEGGNGVAFRSAGDPRTPWEQDPLGGFDENIPLYHSLLYTSFSDDHPLATGVEARLIEAEAQLQAGNFVQMNVILNALRTAEGMGPLGVPIGEAAAIDQLFEERAFWLFLTGHRLADLRRLMYEYGRAEDDVYPTGDYHKGGSYGDDVVFPIDFDEENNTVFDPTVCNVESASIG